MQILHRQQMCGHHHRPHHHQSANKAMVWDCIHVASLCSRQPHIAALNGFPMKVRIHRNWLRYPKTPKLSRGMSFEALNDETCDILLGLKEEVVKIEQAS